MLTAYFRKMLSFEMHFYQTFGFSMFSNNYLNTSKKKTDLLFCFWFRDSRVIIVTLWPSFESAEQDISRHITITYTRKGIVGGPVLLKKIYFCDFRGVPDPCPPSGSAHALYSPMSKSRANALLIFQCPGICLTPHTSGHTCVG